MPIVSPINLGSSTQRAIDEEKARQAQYKSFDVAAKMFEQGGVFKENRTARDEKVRAANASEQLAGVTWDGMQQPTSAAQTQQPINQGNGVTTQAVADSPQATVLPDMSDEPRTKLMQSAKTSMFKYQQYDSHIQKLSGLIASGQINQQEAVGYIQQLEAAKATEKQAVVDAREQLAEIESTETTTGLMVPKHELDVRKQDHTETDDNRTQALNSAKHAEDVRNNSMDYDSNMAQAGAMGQIELDGTTQKFIQESQLRAKTAATVNSMVQGVFEDGSIDLATDSGVGKALVALDKLVGWDGQTRRANAKLDAITKNALQAIQRAPGSQSNAELVIYENTVMDPNATAPIKREALRRLFKSNQQSIQSHNDMFDANGRLNNPQARFSPVNERSSEAQQLPSEEQFNSMWSAAAPGTQMIGPDGQVYEKGAQ